jgi:hypothetical protein
LYNVIKNAAKRYIKAYKKTKKDKDKNANYNMRAKQKDKTAFAKKNDANAKNTETPQKNNSKKDKDKNANYNTRTKQRKTKAARQKDAKKQKDKKHRNTPQKNNSKKTKKIGIKHNGVYPSIRDTCRFFIHKNLITKLKNILEGNFNGRKHLFINRHPMGVIRGGSRLFYAGGLRDGRDGLYARQECRQHHNEKYD